MPTHRVVIIGASTTGLFAAAAAAGSGRAVTVLDRDDLPPDPVPRPGVPQGRQPHVFLHRGVLAAEELLPGFRDDLLAVGAVPINTAELAWLGEQGWTNPHQQILRGVVRQSTVAGNHPPSQGSRAPRSADRRRSSGRRAGNHRVPVDGHDCSRWRVRRRSGDRRIRPELPNSDLARKQTDRRGPHDPDRRPRRVRHPQVPG